jgi:ribonuclease-3
LQELLQSRRFSLPEYQVVNITGQAHSQIFHVRCSIDKMNIKVDGEGKSRRKAEQDAAEKAFLKVEIYYGGN